MKNVQIAVLAIQGRASEDNDHHAEVWVHIDVDFQSRARRIMFLREDSVWALFERCVEALYVHTDGNTPTCEDIDVVDDDEQYWCRECLMAPVFVDGDECDRCIRAAEAVSMNNAELIVADTLSFGYVPEHSACTDPDCYKSDLWHHYGGSDTPTPCDTCEQPLSYDEKRTGDVICTRCLGTPTPKYMRRCGNCHGLIHIETGIHEMGAKCRLAE